MNNIDILALKISELNMRTEKQQEFSQLINNIKREHNSAAPAPAASAPGYDIGILLKNLKNMIELNRSNITSNNKYLFTEAIEVYNNIRPFQEAPLPEAHLPPPGLLSPMVPPVIADETGNYDSLDDVLTRAFDQASKGKGKERHAQDLPFEDQPMQQISKLVGSPDGMFYQAIKKVQESVRLPTKEMQSKELLGAIVYIAGIIIYLERN